MDLFTLEGLFTAQNLIALLTLASLEIVLGIDNIVFIAILTSRLDPSRRASARRTGLVLAMGMRILLLLGIKWIMGLTEPLFAVFGHALSGKDLILVLGGLFLIAKATYEIHHKMEEHDEAAVARRAVGSFAAALVQIVLIDIVFSLDSVITAVGMAQDVRIMILAVVAAVGVMMIAAGPISGFIERHPTLKMLALSFLLLIGVMLVVEGVEVHVNKGYIYFAMGFSLFVEALNIRAGSRRRARAVAIE